MSTTKHTPGPWVFDGANGKILIGKNELLISCKKTIGGASYTDDWYADAKVITAAPELLAELQRCRITFEQIKESYEPDNSEYGIAQATINEIDKVLEKAGLPKFL